MDRINVVRSLMPPIEEYIEEIQSIWDSHWMTNMGCKHQKLEEMLKKYLQVPNLSLMSNGHMSIELSLQALQVTGEVITTPFTFASTTHAIVRNKLQPVFCDIKEEDFTIDEEKIESLITPKTTAILPVHVYGNVCNVEKIQEIANEYNLKVIYDAAHTFGETWNNQGIGTFGDVSIFSFHATKIFNTIEGGAVCYHDPDIGKKLYYLKNFGIKSEDVVEAVGANAKMNEFEAAMGICNLKYVDQEIEKRKHIVEKYRGRLQNIPGIQLNVTKSEVRSNYAYFPIVVHEDEFGRTRDDIYDILKEHNIYARKYFYPITKKFNCYKGRFDQYDTPVAEKISQRILTLPLYGDMGLNIVDTICDIINSLYVH